MQKCLLLVHQYIYTYEHIYIYHMRICTYICTHIYIRTCKSVYRSINVHIYIHEISFQTKTKAEKIERQVDYSLGKKEMQVNSTGI